MSGHNKQKFHLSQSYSYILSKVWYHQIWIQNTLGFMVLILKSSQRKLHNTPWSNKGAVAWRSSPNCEILRGWDWFSSRDNLWSVNFLSFSVAYSKFNLPTYLNDFHMIFWKMCKLIIVVDRPWWNIFMKPIIKPRQGIWTWSVFVQIGIAHPRTTDAQRANSLHCTAENSLPNF